MNVIAISTRTFSVTFLLAAFCPFHEATMILQHSWHYRGHWMITTVKSRARRLFASRTDGSEERVRSMNDSVEDDDEDPFGPPSVLASLKVQESYTPLYLSNDKIGATSTTTSPLLPCIITRLSHNPDIFLVRNFVPAPEQRDALIAMAQQQGLKSAGTRGRQSSSSSEAHQTIRKNSYLTWIDPYDDAAAAMKDDTGTTTTNVLLATTKTTTAIETARLMTELTQALFVHDTLSSPATLFTCEDLQVAKYRPTGYFDLHHDGFNRFLTVLTYLNGVGGTYFPMAQTTTTTTTTTTTLNTNDKQTNDDTRTNNNIEDERALLPPKLKRCYQITTDGEQQQLFLEKEFKVGQEGLLVVGTEGEAAYSSSSSSSISSRNNNLLGVEQQKNDNAIVRIQPGDAIVFYNYKFHWNDQTAIIENNYRSMHAGLRVPQEKWIATNWLRMK